MELSSNPKPLNEIIDDEGINDLIAELRLIPDGNIIGSGDFRTVNEMIDHLERKTPAGMKFLKLHRELKQRLAQAQTEKEQHPGVGARVRGAIKRILSF